MEEVFISYTREDLARAKELRVILREQGWSVFLDEQLPPGVRWDAALQDKLERACCIIALWSERSNESGVQFDEANYALSRASLIVAKLDDATLPLGLRAIQHINLGTWTGGQNHDGISRLLARTERLINAAKARPPEIGEIRVELAGRPDTADRHSVSNRTVDVEAILGVLSSVDTAVQKDVRDAYRSLELAHNEAKFALNDDAPHAHYRDAASNFRRALLSLSEEMKSRLVPGCEMPIEYFLNIELANALVFSVGDSHPVSDEAISIYEGLARRFPNDTAVFLRLGRARVKVARSLPTGSTKRSELQAAIRDLNKALSCAPLDALINRNHWVYFEAPLQIGLCFWTVANFPDLPVEKRIEGLQLAVMHTAAAIERELPEKDHDDFVKFIKLRAAGNIIFYHGHLLRENCDGENARKEIQRNVSYLREEASWRIVRNQPRIIDSILFAATSTGDLELAREMAKLNFDNIGKILHERDISPEENEIYVRARETDYLLNVAERLKSQESAGSPQIARTTRQRIRRGQGAWLKSVGIAVLVMAVVTALILFGLSFVRS